MGVLVLTPSNPSVMHQSSKSQIPSSLEEIAASACLSRPLPPIPEDEEFDRVAPDEDPFMTFSSEKTKSSINLPRRVNANSCTVITSKRPQTKRVAEAATQVDEQLVRESSPEPRRIMKQKVLVTPPRNFHPNTRRSNINYESLCETSLNGSPTETCIPSPKGAHVNARWGQSSMNWTMWSVWEPNLMSHPFFNKLKDVSDEVNCSKQELQVLINDVLSTFCDGEFSEFADEDFVVLLVTQKCPEQAYFPCSERIEIEVKEVKFTPYLSESVATITVSPAYILACGSLADILRAIVVPSDVLLLSGGYRVNVTDNKHGVPIYALNFEKEALTQLVRVPLRKDDIFLMEKIEPWGRGASFRFSYVAKRNLTRRNVVQHRDFIYNEFCRNVTDTLAFERNRWDFPMPIVHNAEPRDIYDLLVLPNFRMMSSGKNHSFDESSSPNTSMSASTVPCYSDDDQNYDTAKESFLEHQHDEMESRPLAKRVSFESSPEGKDMPVFLSGHRRLLKNRVSDDLDFDDDSFSSSQHSQYSQQGSQPTTRNYFDRSHNQSSSQRQHRADTTPKFDPPDQPSSFCLKRFHGKCYCICNLMFWIILLLLIFFVIATICVVWVSFKSDTCQVKPTGVSTSTYPVTDSYIPFANAGEENSMTVIGRSNNESILSDTPWFKDKWNVVKDWVASCIKWIDENCGLECILAKMGIYIDF